MLIPTKQQLEFLNWEIGAFFHFGIRSFFPGHEDWDGKPMPMEKFDPKEINCDQWMEAARTMGATYAIMTCKHHDGFALWPSRYTEYSVKNTPLWQGCGAIVCGCMPESEYEGGALLFSCPMGR